MHECDSCLVLNQPPSSTQCGCHLWMVPKIFAGLFWLMPFFVACSTLGAVNSNVMNTARMMMAAARRGHLPTVFSFIHFRRMTPIPVLALNALATLLILAIKDFKLVLVYTSYIGNIVAFGSALSLVIMRFKRKDLVRPFKLPLIVPIMLILFQSAALGKCFTQFGL